MGEAIRKDASAEDIIEDTRTSLTNAVARGGQWRTLAEQRLIGVLALYDNTGEQLALARQEAAPLVATVKVEDERSDALLGKTSDDIWNAVGRPAPASDPALELLFPGGIAYYASGDTPGQPDRMEVLAQLLTSSLHPGLEPQQAQAAADAVLAAALTLRQAVEATRGPLARVGVLERVHLALARSAAMELSRLKRLYKAAGFREAEIHAVIPDRSRPKKAAKDKAAKTTPAAEAPQAAPAPEAVQTQQAQQAQ